MVAAAAAAGLALGGCGKEAAPAAAPVPTFAAAGSVTCSEEAYQARDPGGGWKHAQQSFYAVGEPAPSQTDLEHLLVMDAAAVVRYRPDAPRAARAALRDWAGTKAAVVVVPASSPQAPQLEAFTVNRRLVCDGVDAAQLSVFADRRGDLTAPPHQETG